MLKVCISVCLFLFIHKNSKTLKTVYTDSKTRGAGARGSDSVNDSGFEYCFAR